MAGFTYYEAGFEGLKVNKPIQSLGNCPKRSGSEKFLHRGIQE